jgi:Ni,Fe-hydrogenase III large subunit
MARNSREAFLETLKELREALKALREALREHGKKLTRSVSRNTERIAGSTITIVLEALRGELCYERSIYGST